MQRCYQRRSDFFNPVISSNTLRFEYSLFSLIEIEGVIMKKTLVCMFVIALVFGLFLVSCGNRRVGGNKWSEGKMAVGTIKGAIEVYRARNGDELARLGAGGNVTAIEALIKLETAEISDLQYFNPACFTYTIVDNAAPVADEFVVTLNAATAPKPGGPTTGTVTYTSATGIWVVP